MRTEVKNFKRIKLFEFYHNKTNPFIYVTTKIDITKLYNKCSINKNTYATIGYYFSLAVNSIDAFKYRYENGKIYKYDILKPNFTQMFDDETIGYFVCDMKDNLESFIEEYKKIENEFLITKKSFNSDNQGEIWFSCQPWFNFTGVITPYDKEISVPQIIWDKFSFENDRCYINLMIMVHHGFADGYHIGLLINKINEIIDNI